MSLRNSFAVLVLLVAAGSLAAAGLPIFMRAPGLASRVQTHHLLAPMAEEARLPAADSLELAVWPLGRVPASCKNLLRVHDDHRFLTWGNEKARTALSMTAGAMVEGDDERSAMFVHYGAQVDASYGERLTLWGRWWSGHYNGDLDWANQRSPLVRGWLKRQEDGIYLDDLEGWICADTDWGEFAVGRGAVQQGAGVLGSIILSRDAGPYGWTAWELDAGPLRLSMMHGSLLPDEPDSLYDYIRFNEKYIMLHRMDVRLHKRLDLFVGETIVYGDRAPDVNYLLPHTFLRIVEHKLHDRDNVAIFAGVQWRALDWLTLYGQGYLDELRKAEIFGDWWGNKYAVQGGAAIEAGRLPGGVPRFVVEGVAIRPWLYTHYTPAGDYTHDGIGLGYPLGANLLAVSAEANLPVLARLDIDARATFARQGDVGANPTTNYNDRPADTASWLEGETTDTLYIDGAVEWRPLAHHSLRLATRVTATSEETQADWLLGWNARY